MTIYTSKTLEDTHRIAREWLKRAEKIAETGAGALTVGLSGHLGAGKTAFTKVVAKELGITEEITSPTFVIMKIYPTTHTRWKRLIHVDAYRLEQPEEMKVLNLEQYSEDPSTLIIIEWPENVGWEDKVNARILFEIKDEIFTIMY